MYTIYTVDYTLNPDGIRTLGPDGTPDSDKVLALFSSVMQEHGVRVYICSSTIYPTPRGLQGMMMFESPSSPDEVMTAITVISENEDAGIAFHSLTDFRPSRNSVIDEGIRTLIEDTAPEAGLLDWEKKELEDPAMLWRAVDSFVIDFRNYVKENLSFTLTAVRNI